jgi:uncharacterized protein (TIGR02996 family)
VEEDAFWAAIAAAPDDDLPLLVLADRFEEQGDPRAACLRWIVSEHKRPAYDRVDTKTWDWWSRPPAQPIHYDIAPRQYVVPLNLFTRLTPPGFGLWKGDAGYEAAVRNLCGAWRNCVRDGVDPLGDDHPRIGAADDDLALKRGSSV